jgi:purine/pyrimidine-nucleoside phosphorylase
MLKVNEYFDGKVKSIGFAEADGNATVGVIEQGEYAFGTSTVEIMVVTSGELLVQLPRQTEWQLYKPFEQFKVDKGVTFKVKVTDPVSYVCYYR